ncbi:MAG TPA: hypothetical protein RMF84_09125 [Polyangiaceae bacterium LLY-WYZ-14_1]|nr:hypothetical protein [Polyangiaceae bacterium LLY-WYZ-14_1]
MPLPPPDASPIRASARPRSERSPVQRVGGPVAPGTGQPPGGARRSFADALAAVAAGMDRNERKLGGMLARVGQTSGQGSEHAALLSVQAAVYRYAHDLELGAKLLDAGMDGVRRVMDSQR